MELQKLGRKAFRRRQGIRSPPQRSLLPSPSSAMATKTERSTYCACLSITKGYSRPRLPVATRPRIRGLDPVCPVVEIDLQSVRDHRSHLRVLRHSRLLQRLRAYVTSVMDLDILPETARNEGTRSTNRRDTLRTITSSIEAKEKNAPNDLTEEELEFLLARCRLLKEKQMLQSSPDGNVACVKVSPPEHNTPVVGPLFYCYMGVEGVPVVAMVDCGSQTTIISRAFLHRVSEQLRKDGRVVDANGSPIRKGWPERTAQTTHYGPGGFLSQGWWVSQCL